ncbi:6509_t:CDS:2, partial [Gigaspora margarita]
CGELWHIAKNCLSEKTEKFEAQYKLVKWPNKEKGQDKNINLVIVESSEEEEVYVTYPQLYTKDRKGVKSKQKQTDSCEKNKILFNVNEKLEKEQFSLAESLLNENTHVFTQKISKAEQTVGLEQTNL